TFNHSSVILAESLCIRCLGSFKVSDRLVCKEKANHRTCTIHLQWNIVIFCSLFISRSEEHTSELQSRFDLVCRLLLEKKKINKNVYSNKHISYTFLHNP